MNPTHSGSAVPRFQVFVLNDGEYVVQWGESQVQVLLSGDYRPFSQQDFGRPITDDELDRLKELGRVEAYDRSYVWLFALPEQGRFDEPAPPLREPFKKRVRVYYINTTLPCVLRDEVEMAIATAGMDAELSVREYLDSDVIGIFAREGKPFQQLKDAETVQRQLTAHDPRLFGAAAVAFIEQDERDSLEPARAKQTLELADIIASQTRQSAFVGTCAIVALADADERQTLAAVLEGELGMFVLLAPDGHSAIDQLQDCAPDRVPRLLITDMRLPDVHAWTLLEKLRELDYGRELRVIVLAEPSASENDQAFALQVAGVDVFLIKPVSAGRLRLSVWTALA